MKKYLLLGILSMCSTFFYAQETKQTTAKDNRPVREYLRPSISVLYVNRGNDSRTTTLINEIKAKGISRKFDINFVTNDVLSYGADAAVDTKDLQKYLEDHYAREIVRNWFPSYDEETKGFTTSVIEDRGMFAATDADVIKSQASVRKEAMLKDAGLNLINRSYILIYDIMPVTLVNGDSWTTSCDLYIYKLDWSDEVSETFYQQWSDPEAIEKCHFPVTLVAALRNARLLSGLIGTPNEERGKTAAQDLAEELYDRADVYTAQHNEDFKAKAPVFGVSPITSKLGVKEGVKPERRYFIYQIEQGAGSSQKAKRVAVVRASNRIALNDTMATGHSALTRFYQTQGAQVYRGMLMQEYPDFGISAGGYLTYNETGAFVEYNVTKLAAEYFPKNPILGISAFLRLGYPFGQKHEGKRIYLGYGIIKEFNFMRFVTVSPYLGYASAPEVEVDGVEHPGLDGFILGLRGGVNLTPEINVFAVMDYNGVKKSISDFYYSEGTDIGAFSFGIGAKYSF